MNIAIMICRKLINKCSCTGCFDVYNSLSDSFEIYESEKPKLVSIFCCKGCDSTKFEGEDWCHKINQLKNRDVYNIHLAKCVEIECEDYEKQVQDLKNEGFKVIRGTHK